MSLLRILLWPLEQRKTKSAPLTSELTLSERNGEQPEHHEQIRTLAKGDKSIRYFTPNQGCLWRVKTLFTKEPDTIAWIEGFHKDEILVDIGANVGMYSIWAAVTRGVRVFAFEPESQNYAILNKNIFINQLNTQVTAYAAALSDHTGFSLLHLGQFMAGGSCHTFEETLDYNLEERTPVFSQGAFATTLDNLVSDGVIPVPQHIKVDVDGIEHRVLAGCKKTLTDPSLKSVLVEINNNLPIHQQIVVDMADLGFYFDPKQVEASIRKDGPFKGVGNYVFIKR